MTDETCTICLSLTPVEAKALELALRDTEEALGATSLDLKEKYYPNLSQTTEKYREASESLLENYREELKTVSNGKRIAEEAGVYL